MIHLDESIEPERYELTEGPSYTFDVPRRDFVKMIGGGIAVLCLMPEVRAQDPFDVDAPRAMQSQTDLVGGWLHIDEDGAVTAYSGRIEMGQGTRTGLAVVVAEELGLSPTDVKMVMGDTAMCPFDRGTWGSGTVPRLVPQMRQAAAAARRMLVNIAAERWGVDAANMTVRDGNVSTNDGAQSASFGELTRGEQLVEEIGPDVEPNPNTQWTVSGKRQRNINGTAIVTGEHRYTWDINRPGMWHGMMLRPRSFGATIASIDVSAAEAMDNVVVVRDGDFVGVAAPDEATADRARRAINVQWNEAEQPSHTELFDHLRATVQERGGGRGRGRGGATQQGSIEDGLAAADQTFKQAYLAPYIAHVPLETRAAVAEWDEDGSLHVWASTQSPFGVRSGLAQAFRMDEERIRVQTPDIGSGYGGKGQTADVAIEAARLAKAAGRPVKIAWTREEEMTWAYFRPAAVIDIESGVKQDGTITAWRMVNINSGGSALDAPYAFANKEVEFKRADSPLRQGSYRALAATANNFARESHLDEVAAAVGVDPLALRLTNLDNERMINVLNAAAEKFGWAGRRSGPGRGYGIACGFDKSSYVATCAEVTVDEGRGEIRVDRIVEAFECGAIINPENVENQVVGAIIQGLGGALFEGIQFENGRILNRRLAQYRLPRFLDVPEIETVLLDRKDLTSVGAGETPIIGVAPAIANAIHDATGVRLRNLPLTWGA